MFERFRQRSIRERRPARTFFSRLRHDTRGNVLLIMGLAVIPMLALIGSGIDVSRAYMAQARLQQACDAASLAGRRAMSNGVVDATVRTEATKFFNFNFPQGSFKTDTFTPAVTGAANSTVVVTASTTIPTTIMRFFGFSTLPISATCNARQDFVNTDIVLVLDTTGSMLDDVNGNAVNGGSTSKIAGLRSAVLALYDELAPVQTQLAASGLRLRYGVVPYSSSVNVGGLIRTINPDYLNDATKYQSRVADYKTAVIIGTAGSPTATTETYSSAITSAQCTSYGSNSYPSGSGGTPVTTGTAPNNQTTTSYSYGSWTKTSGSGTSAKGTCVRNKSVTTTTYVTRYKASSDSAWTYTQDEFDTSSFKGGGSVKLATNTGGTMATSGTYNAQEIAKSATNEGATTTLATTTSPTWAGCIEERKTIATITSSSGYTIPSGAYDLNIDYIPNSADTRWSPHWPQLIYQRSSTASSSSYTYYLPDRGTAYIACPSAAVALKTWTRAELATYVNGLVAVGGTYHDIGMIWGGRLISPGGIFGSTNPSTYGSMPVTRHVIFLTDGAMAPNNDTYTSYGLELLDQRVTGSATAANQLANHKQRFLMTCNAIKSMNVSIWVIGFAQALDSSLTTCASNTNQAVTSGSQSDLITKFVEIGKNIGSLRLTQ